MIGPYVGFLAADRIGREYRLDHNPLVVPPDRLGLVSPMLMAVHMTQLEDAEIERVAAAGGGEDLMTDLRQRIDELVRFRRRVVNY